MKTYFQEETLQAAKQHALECFPNESCGFIVKRYSGEQYVPFENKATEPNEEFRIDKRKYIYYTKRIKAIVHSHIDYPHASKHDMIQQRATNVPWGVINLLKSGYRVEDMFFWGDSLPIQDLVGRPFYFGVYDCYALVRDYYRYHGLIIPDYPRDWLFWYKDIDMIMENFEDAGFYEIPMEELRAGDAIMGRVAQDKIVNHTGIYLGNDRLLHHMAGLSKPYKSGLSRRDHIGPWRKYITKCVRHKDAKKHSFVWGT